METWRLLRDGPNGPGTPAWNMAVDESLLRLATGPVLRLYEWSVPAVSLGYFQPAAVAPAGRPCVRRYTGGGLVDHARDVTYTVAAPRAHPLGLLSTAESYSRLHAAVAAALQDIGLDAVLSPVCDAGDNPACFQKAVKFDVLHQGKKVAGAAQRRTCSSKAASSSPTPPSTPPSAPTSPPPSPAPSASPSPPPTPANSPPPKPPWPRNWNATATPPRPGIGSSENVSFPLYFCTSPGPSCKQERSTGWLESGSRFFTGLNTSHRPAKNGS